MKISLRGWFVLGTLTVLMVAWALSGAPFLNAADSRTSNGQLTEGSLGDLLKAMGLEPKKVQKRYDFDFKSQIGGEEWELSMSAVLSQNGQTIWVMAWLDELPRSANDVPRTALLRLLADNDRLGKGKFFAYVASNRRFVLQRIVPNQQITTAAFRGTLKDLGETVVETFPHWTVANWKGRISQPSSTASKAPAGPSAHSPVRTTKGTISRPPLRSADRNTKFQTPIRR